MQQLKYLVIAPFWLTDEFLAAICKEYKAIGYRVRTDYNPQEFQASDVALIAFSGQVSLICCANLPGTVKQIHRYFYRTPPYGTACGNQDAMRLARKFAIAMPERAPPGIARFAQIKQKRQPAVKVTFEHVQGLDQCHLLVVPRKSRYLESVFAEICDELELGLVRSETEIAKLIPEVGLWFDRLDRMMILYEMRCQRDDPYFAYAKLYRAALQYDIDVERLDSVHLLADFGEFCPRFRMYWTSNK